MRKKLVLLSAVFGLGLFALSSCSNDEDVSTKSNDPVQELATSKALTYVSIYSDEACSEPIVENAPLTSQSTSISFPLTNGITTVYIKYPTSKGTKVFAQNISDEGKSVAATKADAGSYQYFNTETDKYTTITVAVPEDAVKNYVTNKDGFTNYHSSGVAMFEDTWPSKSNTDGKATGSALFGDFNDLVVDYDLEATVNDEADTLQAWKEDLKVVMHIRAMGGGYAQKFGLLLEGLEKQYVDTANINVTLGNYDEPTDPLTAEVKWDANDHPIIYINDLQKLIKDVDGNTTKGQPGVNSNGMLLSAVPATAVTAASNPLYNTKNDVNLNVGKGLITVTVTFRGAERSKITAEQHVAQTENYKNAVINTNLQNFFLVTLQKGKTYEIHMSGYKPTSDYTTYAADMNDPAAGTAVAKDAAKTYTAADKNVWALKVPVITRHATERTAFIDAYPLYNDWITTGNPSSALWYLKENANQTVKANKITFIDGTEVYPFEYIINAW